MIEFSVKIPSKGSLTEEEQYRVIWAIFNALTTEMPKDVGDLNQLYLNKIIVNRK